MDFFSGSTRELVHPLHANQRLSLTVITQEDHSVQVCLQTSGASRQVIAEFEQRHVAEAWLQRWWQQRLTEGYVAQHYVVPAVSVQEVTLDPLVAERCLKRLATWSTLSTNQRSRLVWLIGELRIQAASSHLLALLPTNDALLDYCLIWALARLGDVATLAKINTIMTEGKTTTLKRVATWAYLQLASTEEKMAYGQSLISQWASAIQVAWQTQNVEHIKHTVKTLMMSHPAGVRLHAEWLEQVGLLAQCQPFARQVMLALLVDWPLKAGYFRVARHLYKAAELCDDVEVWALLQRRFETTKAYFQRGTVNHTYVNYRYLPNVDQELKKANSELAYSQLTRHYLLRRGWRWLRRMGYFQRPEYVEWAFAVLKTFDDGKAAEHHKAFLANRMNYRSMDYHAHSSSILFNRVLGLERKPAASRIQQVFSAQERPESYPHLWNQRPDLALQLALTSCAQQVQAFAVNVLVDCPDYCQHLDVHIWQALVLSPYEKIANFAANRILAFFNGSKAVEEQVVWLGLLLACSHTSITKTGLFWLNLSAKTYITQPALWGVLMNAQQSQVRRQIRVLAPQLRDQLDVVTQIWPELLQCLLSASADNIESIVTDLRWLVQDVWRHGASTLDMAVLVALTQHAQPSIALLAVDWLMQHQQFVAQNPSPTLMRYLLEHSQPALVAAGLRLLKGLTLAVLQQQMDLVLGFCLATESAIRQEALALLIHITSQQPDLAISAVLQLLPALYRTETSDGLHDDLYQALTGGLAETTQQLSLTTTLSLLFARAQAAQRLGAWLLQFHADEVLPDKEWLRLARCDSQAVRQRALTVLDRHFAEIDRLAWFGVLDGAWTDSRDAVLTWLRQRVANSEWHTAELITLADHAQPSVQQLGCQLLTERLALGRDTEVLAALAEHPALTIQQFVADWLEQVLATQPERFLVFFPYFRTVLVRVNRGRKIKNTILRLLRYYALQSESMAHAVAELFSWLSMTVAVGDKAQYIVGLNEIRRHFPAIALPLQLENVAIRETC